MRVSLRRRLVRLRRCRMPIFLPVLGVALVLFACFWWAVNACLRPAVETLAVSDAVNRVSLAISQSVARCVSEQGVTYSDLVSIETDAAGNVTSLTRDLASASRLNALLVEYITEDLGQLQQEEFGIPLGTLTGWVIFSGKGPVIEVELLSAGDVTTRFRHNFEQADINQTLHQVMLEGLPSGLRPTELRWEEAVWDETTAMFLRRGSFSCSAYFVATATEEGAWLTDFILKGVVTP